MTFPNTVAGGFRAVTLAIGIAALSLAVRQARAVSPIPAAPVAVPTGRWRDASLDDYRKHLMTLTTLVEACAKARDIKSCDPMLVGPDDRVPLGSGPKAGRRLVRYGWLRVLFSKAEEPDLPAAKAAPKGAAPENLPPAPPTTSQLLQDAETRLAADLAQAEAVYVPPPAHAEQRAMMKQVLAGRDFRNVEAPTLRQSMMEQLGNWLNHVFENASRLRATSAWVGRVLVVGFVVAVCVALVWGLLRLERRWRVRLVPDGAGPAAGAASARDWQLWLEDARRAAAAGLWREAIHFVYWAAISRLESRRLWPADRARTPREYLALVAPEDPRKAGLAQLTGSFERTWYGGRSAAESDYRRAEELASALIAGGASAVASQGGAR